MPNVRGVRSRQYAVNWMGRVSGSRYRAKMKAKDVFDACYGRYRSLHDWLEDATGKVRASRDIRGDRRADTPANTLRIRALGRWCAAASGMEGQAEALRDLLSTYHGVQERDPSETSWPHPGHREIAYDLRSRLTRNCRISEMPPVNGMKSRFFISVERCSILSWIASASVCFATTTAVTYLMKLTPHFSQLPPARC